MTMYKTIPTLVLLFTGYLRTDVNVSADTPIPYSFSPPPKDTQDPELETPLHKSDSFPEEHLSSLIVAGISMTVVFLFILVIIGACYVWKKSKRSLVANNSAPSSEPGMSLKDFQNLKTNTSGLLEAHYPESGRPVA